jgi:tripartite-type tricarboxylate transporter receptor subunit TctC
VNLDRQPVVLVPEAGNPSTIEALLLNGAPDLRMKVVGGFNEGERNSMILSGDADILIGSYTTVRPLIDSGDLTPVVRFDATGYPDDIMKLPTLAEVLRPDAAKEVAEFLVLLNKVGRSIAAAPSTPADVVAALRTAFDMVIADPAYAKRMDELQLINSPTTGGDLETRMNGLLAESGSLGSILADTIACGEKSSESGTPGC